MSTFTKKKTSRKSFVLYLKTRETNSYRQFFLNYIQHYETTLAALIFQSKDVYFFQQNYEKPLKIEYFFNPCYSTETARLKYSELA